jgi:hypothetical protein
MTTYTISEDQNLLTASSGEQYKAETEVRYMCTGCEFDGRCVTPLQTPCTSSSRKDGRSIIWVKKSVKTLASADLDKEIHDLKLENAELKHLVQAIRANVKIPGMVGFKEWVLAVTEKYMKGN